MAKSIPGRGRVVCSGLWGGEAEENTVSLHNSIVLRRLGGREVGGWEMRCEEAGVRSWRVLSAM